MANTIQTYLDLITSEYSEQPNFNSVVSFNATPCITVQDVLLSMIPKFDLDTPPVGDQLDIIGKWVGVSRDVAIPITGVLFSWDDVASDGWEMGIWSSVSNPTVITVLPDDAYLTLILARIAANHWDGTTEGAYTIWEAVFPQYILLIEDQQDMSFIIGIIGQLDSLTYQLLIQGYLPLRPEGVLISGYYTQKDTNPFFGWDVDNSYISGWGTGSWPVFIVSP